MKILEGLKTEIPKAEELKPEVSGHKADEIERVAEEFANLFADGITEEGKKTGSSLGFLEGNINGDGFPERSFSGERRISRQFVDKCITCHGDRQPSGSGSTDEEGLPAPNFFTESVFNKDENAKREDLIPSYPKKSEEERPFETGKDPVDTVISQMREFSINLNTLFSLASVDNVRSDSTVEPLPENVRKMIERILVEAPGTSHKQEVRIRLNQDILPDTDIRIFRDKGRLEVHFITGSRESYDFLSPGILSLKDALESRQGEPVNVCVEYTGGNGSEENYGRSRGHIPWDEDENS